MAFFGQRKQRSTPSREEREAREFLEQLGRETGHRVPPIDTLGGSVGGGGRTPIPIGTAVSAPYPGTVFTTRTKIPREPPRPGEENEYGAEIFTPQSSNVFSFSFFRRAAETTGTLYVTYKAHAINPGSVRHVTVQRGGRRSRTQLRGTLGRTVGGKTNERGPTYAYLRVPPGVYNRMVSASSKGKFVWDNLRIRGTIYGHRYQYTLMQGQVTPSTGGVYVPRKATKEGFRSRSIVEVGRGQRGFQTSTLPQQNGFSTRRTR